MTTLVFLATRLETLFSKVRLRGQGFTKPAVIISCYISTRKYFSLVATCGDREASLSLTKMMRTRVVSFLPKARRQTRYRAVQSPVCVKKNAKEEL